MEDNDQKTCFRKHDQIPTTEYVSNSFAYTQVLIVYTTQNFSINISETDGIH